MKKNIWNLEPKEEEASHFYVNANDSSFLSPISWFLGGLAMGAAAMYFFDPQSGNRRRAYLGQKSIKAKNEFMEFSDRMGRHLKNRATGMVAKMESYRHLDDPVDDQVLNDRVRAAFGRKIKHTGAIQVSALDGEVTISGPILRDEVQALLACVEAVPGVKKVINELDIHETPGHTPSLQGEGKAYLQ
jgi:hypothetical protein